MRAEPIVSTPAAAPARSAATASPAARTTEHRAPTPSRQGLGVPTLAAIGLGGALGSVARYGITSAAPVADSGFPWATWSINLTGSFVLAVVVTLVIERWPPTRYVRPFVGIGICGGFTTWSTFMTETVLLGRDQRVGLAVLYLAVSLVGGLAATGAGIWVVRNCGSVTQVGRDTNT